jgi:hypothetical protein
MRKLTHPAHLDSEDGGGIHLRNIGSTANVTHVQRLNGFIDVNSGLPESLNSLITLISLTFVTITEGRAIAQAVSR